ncbi:MAG: dephospho-CoA kinase [Flavobacteriales bacterium]|jgi:dephospho-CoA kinase|uniref:dephospho-CoA kinase n=1 Tax=Blattabacterium sp. (Mastotermes darwiniensis) TaxID=39768 RepID=UPI000231DE99|nr:dephospho-CoA kinase [Blattabacterium sp. (Mastotermes darwiniensis)]AER40717.1 putative dephospho-CoA kinase [Blattabacterium sp. (Mastotermes darwiniensis) str. MADAR]MDR1804755.1 dephospho-CoA kinase [Flavobacteriales bacterium]
MKSLLIGLTGKMGSGKSLFTSFFQKNGIPVYYSDQRGKIIMNQTKILKKNIIKFFGKKSYENKTINTKFLSKKVFTDPLYLKLLCSIVHPWVLLDFKKWRSSQKTLYLIKESALLFESGTYKDCDYIITITSPTTKMIERIIKRDKLSEEQIMNRLKIQISNKERIKYSNIIVENIQDISFLKEKAKEIHHKIIINGKRR